MRPAWLELVAREVVALAPLAIIWWYGLMDDDDRAAALERARGLIDRLTNAELRDWLESPAALFARERRADMIRGELEAPVDARGSADVDTFLERIRAEVAV